ncbi:DgyrCDS10172 [Dimorphilus gyrociliatus]|uniref:Transmembrane protein 198 n=1 Tax=Dimorphilus gyrociliatus TaxID=2664684 RepID=A0A7I8W1F2_9ANNE|nr:DgyrCDS10172 [Dimorphilus gyrociliatus]
MSSGSANVSRVRPTDPTFISSTLQSSTIDIERDSCLFGIVEYDVIPAAACAICAIFGLLYTFFGYKFFKAVMFITGLMLGGSLTWLICKNAEAEVLGTGGAIGISFAAGLMTGLITMLLEMVGLFITGFVLGGLLGISTLVSILYLAPEPLSRWSSLGLILGIGLLFALSTLYWKRALVIVGTSGTGAFLLTISLDYFVEEFRAVKIIPAALHQLKDDPKPELCWISWVLLIFWPFATLIGIVIQFRVTSKTKKERSTVVRGRKQKRITVKSARVYRPTNPARSHRPMQPVARQQQQQQQQPPYNNSGGSANRYRQLYQVRRFNGDVISQCGIENIRHELSPAMRTVLERSRSVSQA